MNKTEVSIIIPVYNEARAIGSVIERIKTLYPNFEIIVVNDGSTDDTAAVAKDAGALVYSHPYNIGNGAVNKGGRCQLVNLPGSIHGFIMLFLRLAG